MSEIRAMPMVEIQALPMLELRALPLPLVETISHIVHAGPVPPPKRPHPS